MARKRTTTRQRFTATTPDIAPDAPTDVDPAMAEAPASAAPTGFHLSTRWWVVIYLVIFLLVEGAIFVAFSGTSGGSREQTAMLDTAQRLRAEDKHGEALAVLLEYGKKWPGAYGTQRYELWLGDYYYSAGKYPESAEHYAASIKADPKVWDTRALAGRSYWLAGKREEALKKFQEELQTGNRESDMAHYYLGLAAMEAGDRAAAFRLFQAVKDRKPYEAELAKVVRELEEKAIAPSRAAARKAASEFAAASAS